MIGHDGDHCPHCPRNAPDARCVTAQRLREVVEERDALRTEVARLEAAARPQGWGSGAVRRTINPMVTLHRRAVV